MEKLIVKIVSAAKDSFWYADHIGEHFEVAEVEGLTDKEEYVVVDTIDHEMFTDFIQKEDCQII